MPPSRNLRSWGSGFKIAMRDLEIRGAGNLLGEEQHGHMEAVGYDLYCKMLGEAVKREKGIPQEEDFSTVVELPVDAYLPPSYITAESQRLDIYKRIAEIASEEEREDMLDELIDRFGEPPKPVQICFWWRSFGWRPTGLTSQKFHRKRIPYAWRCTRRQGYARRSFPTSWNSSRPMWPSPLTRSIRRFSIIWQRTAGRKPGIRWTAFWSSCAGCRRRRWTHRKSRPGRQEMGLPDEGKSL